MYSWFAWSLPAHDFQLSCNQINCLLFCISYYIYFSLCVQSCMEATGQLQDQLLPSTLRSQDSRRVRVVFMCSSPTIRLFAQACWSTAANHNKHYFQDVLKTNSMSLKKLSLHSEKALPCVNLRGQLAMCTTVPSRAASCQTRREAWVMIDTVVRWEGQARPLVTSRDNRRKKYYKSTCKNKDKKENCTATMMNTFHPARIWRTGTQQIKKSTETAHSSGQFNKFSPA